MDSSWKARWMSENNYLEDFLPRFDAVERHEISVRSVPARVWSAVRELDMAESGIVRALYRLRGLPPSAMRLEGLERLGFLRLSERPESELVYGLAGKFWTPTGHLQHLDLEDFRGFSQPGFAKAVWGFRLDDDAIGVRVSTETRVLCLDAGSCVRFKLYWLLVRPFSGWIRREALRLIKRRAEAP